MKIHKVLLTALFLATSFFHADAAYLKNVPQKLIQPDKTVLNCLATGDEFHNWLHDSNNFTIIQDSLTGFYVYAKKSGSRLLPTTFVAGKSDPAAAGLQPGLNLDPEEIIRLSSQRFKIPAFKGSSSVTTTGTINNIVIFIRFSDQPEYSTGTSTYTTAFNTAGSVSMHQYFLSESKSQLTINTTLYPINSGGNTVVSYQDTNPRGYYCKYDLMTNPNGYNTDADKQTREMTLLKNATESIKSQIEATGLDFDNDNDGKIDNICYIIQGAVQGWSDLLWPHMWALYTYDVRISGARVWNFNFQLSQSFGVSVLCHEMSHSIGFPDLYRYVNTTISPVGKWDVMGSNTSPPQSHTAYTKEKYGRWFTGITEISTTGRYTLAPLSTDGYAAYKIKSPNSTSEYFVVEYRKAEGMFESALPGSGLIIYRVTPSLNGNSQGPPDEIYVFRPNGTAAVNGEINSGFYSSESGKTIFNATSNPSCTLSNGAAGGIEITNVGSAGATISFDFSMAVPASVLNVSPGSQNITRTGGTTTFDVTNTGGGTMAWTASVTTGPSWLHITSGASGSNAGTISVSADANPEITVRTGVITVTSTGATDSPKTVNVVQSGIPPVLTVLPASQSVDFQAAATTFEVTNTGGGSMDWTASVTTGSAWVHLSSGATGNNSGTIGVAVDANSDSFARSGIITITSTGTTGSPKTVTINQAENPPVLNILPASQSVAYSAGDASIDVFNSGRGSLTWSSAVTTGTAWIHITSGTSGSNDGTISISVDANPDKTIRTGVITVSAAGANGSPKTAIIEQAGNPILKPDLIITRITATIPEVSWPAQMQIKLTVGNIGQGPSVATAIHFNLMNAAMDSLVSDLGQINCNGISSGSEWTNESRLTFSRYLLTGDYMIAASVDNPALNEESDKSNNAATCRISILNDVQTDPENFSFTVYPVPASNILTLMFESNGNPVEKLIINDILGQVVYSGSIGTNSPFKETIDVSDWKKGLYQISLLTGQKLYHKLIILQ